MPRIGKAEQEEYERIAALEERRIASGEQTVENARAWHTSIILAGRDLAANRRTTPFERRLMRHARRRLKALDRLQSR